MRSSTLLSAVFAIGALAVPHKRGLVTEIDVVEKTVTVIVTATGLPPVSVAATAPFTYTPAKKHHSHSRYLPKPSSSSAAPVVSSVYIAPSSPAPAYTPPASTPKSSPTPAPVPSAVYSSAAPASSAAYGGVGPAHISGEKQADFTSGEDYKNMVLFHHNLNRANYGAGSLTWDANLAAKAADCAKCSNTPFIHCNAGQNMAGSNPLANVSAGITEQWVNSEASNYAPYFGQADPSGDIASYGHFTQVVWKGATKVGCGTVDCTGSGGMWITVCNYDAGNVIGEYGKNVGKFVGTTEAHWYD